MIRPSLALVLVALAAPALALDLEALVAKHSAANGVPEQLVRRVIKIESRGQPHLISKGNYGLMQIRLGTAKAMGYTGTPEGLLDADTNMTYAVRYLAGAYRAANGDANRAVHLYQRGYYAEAKAKHFSPYSVASQTSTPVEKPARKRREVAKPDQPAAPVSPVAVAAPANPPVDSDKPATLQERFAVASPVKPVAVERVAVKTVKPVVIQEKVAAPPPVQPVAMQEVAVPEKVAVTPPVRPVVVQEKVVSAPAVKPVAVRERVALTQPVKPVAPQDTLAAVPQDKPAVRHRRAKASNQPFNLLSYLKSKLASPEKPARRQRYRTRHVAATPRNAAPMVSAATPSAQKP